ncbi:MAG: hypothetical protein ABIJ59_14310 [Pseudomonadota bacterium]
MKISDIQNLSDNELAELLKNSEFDSLARENVSTEINRRLLIQVKKPHWTQTPAFIISVAAMLFAAIAAFPIMRGCIQDSQYGNINSNYQLQQSQLEKTSPKEHKK